LDGVEKAVVERVKCRIHPYLPLAGGWRVYPPHMARLLEVLDPIHVVAVTDRLVAVDGVYIEDDRSLKEKYDLAVGAVERIFGETAEKMGAAFNCEVRLHSSSPVCSICFFQGNVWYLAPCAAEPGLSRFAYIADPNNRLFAHPRIYDGDYVECVAVVGGEPKATVHVSRSFFVEPKPENAELFGDLCFLTQMSKSWTVEREVDPQIFDCRSRYASGSWATDDLREHITWVLRFCIGLRSFVTHGYKELLIRDKEDLNAYGWKALLKMLENRDG